MTHDAIAVIDFGGQYAHLIATKIRRLHVLAEIRQPEDPTEAFRRYKGIILSGSPSPGVVRRRLGLQQGHLRPRRPDPRLLLRPPGDRQALRRHRRARRARVGAGRPAGGGRQPDLQGARPHRARLDEPLRLGHQRRAGLRGARLHDARRRPARRTATPPSARTRSAATGVQFHPEVDDTVHGDEMIANFVLGICGCTPSWTMERYVEERIEQVRRQVGDQSVFLLASGGVDSTVAARLLGMAIGADRLHLLHVDNGLMRKDESRDVLDVFRAFGLDRNLHFVDASEAFLSALAGVIEPEQKRTIIGNTFIEVFEARGQAARHRGPPARPGHDLPGHDRDRRHQARRHHQDASQPRAGDRAPDRAGARRRAARGPVQGRGAGAGREARASRTTSSGATRSRALASACGCSARPATRPARAWPGSSRRWPRSPRATAWRRWPADQVGRGEGRPAVVRAPGARERRRAVGDGGSRWRRASSSEVPGINRCIWNLAPGAPSRCRPARRHGDARAARPAARGRPPRDGRPAPPRHLRRDLAVPDGAGAARSRRPRPRVRHRPADSLRARDDGDAGAAARGARRRTARADPARCRV